MEQKAKRGREEACGAGSGLAGGALAGSFWLCSWSYGAGPGSACVDLSAEWFPRAAGAGFEVAWTHRAHAKELLAEREGAQTWITRHVESFEGPGAQEMGRAGALAGLDPLGSLCLGSPASMERVRERFPALGSFYERAALGREAPAASSIGPARL